MNIGIPIYGRGAQRTTLDAEWEEDELKTNVYDECIKNLPKIAAKYADRAVYDEDMWKPQYMASKICEEHDLIEVYNKEYDRHRNDGKFGIAYFDAWLLAEIKRIASANLVGGKK